MQGDFRIARARGAAPKKRQNKQMSTDYQQLLIVCVEACDALSILVKALYDNLSGDSAKLKEDQSVFTIADGLVQGLLKRILFDNVFKAIVGEEVLIAAVYLTSRLCGSSVLRSTSLIVCVIVTGQLRNRHHRASVQSR
jgi:hypothetical protein